MVSKTSKKSVKKVVAKKTAVKQSKNNTVDYYPNRMPLVISFAAVTFMTLIICIIYLT